MRISVSEAKRRLTELIRQAEAGGEVVLTRNGKAVVRLVPVQPQSDAAARGAVIAAVQAAAERKRTVGPSAVRSQDFLYDDDVLPN